MTLRKDAWFWSLLLLALLIAANAVWMLAEPQHWYHDLPAAVPDTGPYNEHFVRDIGCAFATIAIALGWAAVRPYWRAPLLTVAAIFLSAHAGLHVFDTARGFLDGDHWLLDLPGVYLPAILTVPLAFLALRAAHLRTI